MLFKKYLTFLAVAAIQLLPSCKGHGEPDSEKLPMHFEVNGSVSSIDIDAEGATLTIPVSSDLEWSVGPVSADWLALSAPTSDYSSKTKLHTGQFILKASPNPSGSTREYSVEIKAGKSTSHLKITQHSASELLSKSIVSLTGESPSTVEVKCSGSWSVKSVSDWFTVTPSSGTGSGSFTVKAVDDNSMNVGPRSGVIEAVVSGLNVSIEVVQGQTDNLIVADETLAVPKEGGIISIATLSNSEYTVSIESGKDWIEPVVKTKALNELSESFIIAPNETASERTAEIRFSLGGIKETVTVVQACPDKILFVDTYGAYGIDGASYTYIPGTQISRIYDGNNLTFRVISPLRATVLEVGGIDASASEGDRFEVAVKVMKSGGTTELSYPVTVISADETALRLKNSDVTYFIVKK